MACGVTCDTYGLQNKMHINDWAAIQTLFDKLNKQLEKTQKVTQVGRKSATRAFLFLVNVIAGHAAPLPKLP